MRKFRAPAAAMDLLSGPATQNGCGWFLLRIWYTCVFIHLTESVYKQSFNILSYILKFLLKYVNVENGFSPGEAYSLMEKFQLSLYTLYITSTILLITVAERSLITSKENSQSINHSLRDNQITKHDLTSKQKVCQFWYESLVLYSRKYASV